MAADTQHHTPDTMLAWTFSHRGTPSKVLTLDESHPNPNHSSDHPSKVANILIRVSHVGLSSAGTNLMLTLPHLSSPRKRPGRIAEIDFSGTIVSCGPKVPAHLKPGTHVFGSVPLGAHLFHGTGSLAEYIEVASNCVAVKPDNISMAEPSGLSSLGQTALAAVERTDVRDGATGKKTVLIHGASGGVGVLAVQIAKSRGVRVAVMASERKMDTLRECGAAEVIDYQRQSLLYEYLATRPESTPSEDKFEFDAVLDLVGSQELFFSSPKYLKKDGIYLGIGNVGIEASPLSSITRTTRNVLLPTFLGDTPRQFVTFANQVSVKALQELAELVAQGRVEVRVDSVFSMREALKAYERFSSRNAVGKVIIEVAKKSEGRGQEGSS